MWCCNSFIFKCYEVLTPWKITPWYLKRWLFAFSQTREVKHGLLLSHFQYSYRHNCGQEESQKTPQRFTLYTHRLFDPSSCLKTCQNRSKSWTMPLSCCHTVAHFRTPWPISFSPLYHSSDGENEREQMLKVSCRLPLSWDSLFLLRTYVAYLFIHTHSRREKKEEEHVCSTIEQASKIGAI